MKVAFYAPDGAGDKQIVAAVMAGAARHGDQVQYIQTDRYEGVIADADAVACYGVRASTRIITEAYRRAGKRSLYFDKGYWGRGIYTRVSIDAWHPTAYFSRGRARGRLAAMGLAIKPWRDGAKTIYAGTTQTWADFYNLGPLRELDEMLVKLLVSLRPNVVYRPRPAYAKKHPELCRPIPGAAMSDGRPLGDELAAAGLLVTLGSNAAIEALAAGVQVMVMGDNPCSVANVRSGLAHRIDREQFFSDLAYCQWTLDEYLSGVAWADIKQTMERIACG